MVLTGVLLMKMVGFLTFCILIIGTVLAAGCQPTETKAAPGATATATAAPKIEDFFPADG
jgi:hypothetical protein